LGFGAVFVVLPGAGQIADAACAVAELGVCLISWHRGEALSLRGAFLRGA
jgi:hypothetical protein